MTAKQARGNISSYPLIIPVKGIFRDRSSDLLIHAYCILGYVLQFYHGNLRGVWSSVSSSSDSTSWDIYLYHRSHWIILQRSPIRHARLVLYNTPTENSMASVGRALNRGNRIDCFFNGSLVLAFSSTMSFITTRLVQLSMGALHCAFPSYLKLMSSWYKHVDISSSAPTWRRNLSSVWFLMLHCGHLFLNTTSVNAH